MTIARAKLLPFAASVSLAPQPALAFARPGVPGGQEPQPGLRGRGQKTAVVARGPFAAHLRRSVSVFFIT